MSDLRPGDIVDITIKGVRLTDTSVIRVAIEDEHGETWVLPPQAAITHVAPAEWPPRAGDLWRDRHGSTWFAFWGYDTRAVLMVPQNPAHGQIKTPTPEVVLGRLGPLTLVHREEMP